MARYYNDDFVNIMMRAVFDERGSYHIATGGDPKSLQYDEKGLWGGTSGARKAMEWFDNKARELPKKPKSAFDKFAESEWRRRGFPVPGEGNALDNRFNHLKEPFVIYGKIYVCGMALFVLPAVAAEVGTTGLAFIVGILRREEMLIARIRGTTGDCERSAELLREAIKSGEVKVLDVIKGNHTAFYHNGRWFDLTGLNYAIKNGYWTLEQLAKAGLLKAAQSGIFTSEQYMRFIARFALPE